MKKTFQIFVALFFISIVVFLFNATLFTNTLTNQSEKLIKPTVEVFHIQATNDYILSKNYIDNNIGASLTDTKKQIQNRETRSNSVALGGLLPILTGFLLLVVNLNDIGDGELNFQSSIVENIQNRIGIVGGSIFDPDPLMMPEYGIPIDEEDFVHPSDGPVKTDPKDEAINDPDLTVPMYGIPINEDDFVNPLKNY